MKKLAGITLGTSLAATAVLTAISCSPVLGNTPEKTTPPPPGQTPYVSTVEDFIRNGSTYQFDGINGSLKIVKAVETADGKWDFTIEYQTGPSRAWGPERANSGSGGHKSYRRGRS